MQLFNMGMPVYVSTTSNPSNSILVYAILDSASDHSFITAALVNKLKPKFLQKKLIDMETMSGESAKQDISLYGDLVLNGYFGGQVKLASAYEWPHIPNSTGAFASSMNIKQCQHLRSLENALPPSFRLPVGLLLGANCSAASFPLKLLKGRTTNHMQSDQNLARLCLVLKSKVSMDQK
ncbi:hypothetical protein EB796_015729 [Bugula neritina]|uniref:Uncharacterized protein n=1 Tax=Bugula neritina TaxID=10212 RepID=A0A7J7JJH0_BUGNE|nr:hypothetical protein EB796_015729 [Bugula neritina]